MHRVTPTSAAAAAAATLTTLQSSLSVSTARVQELRVVTHTTIAHWSGACISRRYADTWLYWTDDDYYWTCSLHPECWDVGVINTAVGLRGQFCSNSANTSVLAPFSVAIGCRSTEPTANWKLVSLQPGSLRRLVSDDVTAGTWWRHHVSRDVSLWRTTSGDDDYDDVQCIVAASALCGSRSRYVDLIDS